MIIKENVKNINLKWIYIITGTFLMAIAYKAYMILLEWLQAEYQE